MADDVKKVRSSWSEALTRINVLSTISGHDLFTTIGMDVAADNIKLPEPKDTRVNNTLTRAILLRRASEIYSIIMRGAPNGKCTICSTGEPDNENDDFDADGILMAFTFSKREFGFDIIIRMAINSITIKPSNEIIDSFKTPFTTLSNYMTDRSQYELFEYIDVIAKTCKGIEFCKSVTTDANNYYYVESNPIIDNSINYGKDEVDTISYRFMFNTDTYKTQDDVKDIRPPTTSNYLN